MGVSYTAVTCCPFESSSGEWPAAERTVLWRSFPALRRKAVISTELIDVLTIAWI